jgi:hypothetical protein
MASPTHRENMLSPNYKDIGFAVETGTLTGSDTVLVVEEFGSRYAAANTQAKSVNLVVALSPTIAPTRPAPTAAVSITPNVTTVNHVASGPAIEAAVNKPLIDTKSGKQNLSVIILGIFIIVLIVDAVIIERKKIVRIVSHNLDHIIFLTILLLAAIIIGGGIIK